MNPKNISVPTDASTLAFEKVCSMLNVDVAKGLSAENADERRVTFGDNALPDEKTTPFWKLVLGQFNDTLVQILLAAAGISFSMALLENNPADFVEPFIILLILTLNAIVGVLQENKAEEAIEALKKYAPENAHVLRNGTMIVAPSEQLVPGDIVEVSVGNRVPADIRVGELHSTALRVDQSILTGESKEVLKSAEKGKDSQQILQ
ncbi:calcium-translocating P-type ATPase [Angomonas deanei]|nr:calcium-translocating P-type ATPase [Angomonas deanei]|eukprot:EPY29942.1 calcium-translocating P-type ATPase [Angomonas deanei]